jgi:hypothetical protein
MSLGVNQHSVLVLPKALIEMAQGIGDSNSYWFARGRYSCRNEDSSS